MNKIWYWIIGIVLFLIIVISFSSNDNSSINEVQSIDYQRFNILSIKSLYDNGFCYQGMDGGCGETEYPFIRIYNAEDFEEQGKILLITQVSNDLYEEIPELYNKEIVYIFRDKNQKTVDRIYVKENEWSR